MTSHERVGLFVQNRHISLLNIARSVLYYVHENKRLSMLWHREGTSLGWSWRSMTEAF